MGDSRFERYLLQSELGRGALGPIYRARDTETQEEVALRVISENFGAQADFMARMHAILETWASFSHPNILPLTRHGEFEGKHYIVNDLADGPSLLTLLHQRGPLPVPQSLQWLHQLAGALGVMHAKGQLHGDVRPSNVLLRKDGRVQLTDFGFAPLLMSLPKGEGRETALTVYMAPEQFHGQKTDGRADLYALGVTLYAMLNGGPPFPPDTPLAWIYQVIKVNFPSIREKRPDVPPAIEELLNGLTAFDPAHRCRSAAGLQQYLNVLAGGNQEQARQAYSAVFPERPVEEDDPDADYRAQLMMSLASDQSPGQAAKAKEKSKPPPPRQIPWPWVAAVIVLLAVASGVYAWSTRTVTPPLLITSGDVPFKPGSMWVYELQGQRVAMEVGEKRVHNGGVYYLFRLLPEELGFSFWRAARQDGWHDYDEIDDVNPARVMRFPLQVGMPPWDKNAENKIIETENRLRWVAEAEETVSTPAGEFPSIRVRNGKGTAETEDDDLYWLASPVGLVRVSATSNDQRIEFQLLEYSKLQ